MGATRMVQQRGHATRCAEIKKDREPAKAMRHLLSRAFSAPKSGACQCVICPRPSLIQMQEYHSCHYKHDRAAMRRSRAHDLAARQYAHGWRGGVTSRGVERPPDVSGQLAPHLAVFVRM